MARGAGVGWRWAPGRYDGGVKRRLYLPFLTLLLLVSAMSCGDETKAPPTAGGPASPTPYPTPLSPRSYPPPPPIEFGAEVPSGALILTAWSNTASSRFRVNADGSGLQSLTSGYSGTLSPDGRMAAYTVRDEIFGDSDVFVANADGTNARSVTGMRGSREFVSWSPDGSMMLLGAHAEHISFYFIASSDGLNEREIVSNCVCVPPDWSPDSQSLLAQTGTAGDRYDSKVVILAPDGSVIREISNEDWQAFRWSPDSSMIAYGDQEGIHVVDSGGGVGQLIVRGGSSQTFEWSPDSSTIATTISTLAPDDPSPPGSLYALVSVPATGGSPRTLATSASISQAVWSPDGERIAFTAIGSGPIKQADLFVVEAEGGEPVNITRSQFGDSNPLWSPDSEQLVFSSYRGSDGGLIWLDPGTGRRGQVDSLAAYDEQRQPVVPAVGGCMPQPTSAWQSAPACLSPDGRLRATVAGEQGSGVIRDEVSGEVIRQESASSSVLVTDEATGQEIARAAVGGGIALSPPAWSMDGGRIAFIGFEDGASYLMVMVIETGAITRITRADGGVPSGMQLILWSSDGTEIYFMRGVQCRGGCATRFPYVVGADGTGERQLLDQRVSTIHGFAP